MTNSQLKKNYSRIKLLIFKINFLAIYLKSKLQKIFNSLRNVLLFIKNYYLYISKIISNKEDWEKQINSIKKLLSIYSKNLFVITLLYSFPFACLLKHLFLLQPTFPYLITEEFLVNKFFLRLLKKAPLVLAAFNKIFSMIVFIGQTMQWWILYAYFVIFAQGNFKLLNISYKTAYNGTLALTFLSFDFALQQIEEFLIVPFDMYLALKQLVSHSKFETKIVPSNITLYTDLYEDFPLKSAYNSIQKYEDLHFIVSNFIISPLLFITLCCLVYNCVYYVLKSKNPKIPVISKTAARTMSGSEEDLF